jgi:hypothetical protein
LIGGWCWRRVSDLLEKKGHKVFAPTLTGLGERSHLLSKGINLDTHVADIVNIIKWEGLADFCLVAHSYAGFPASGALEQIRDGASSIVWLDALKPENGEKVIDFVPGPTRELLLNFVAKGEISFPPSGKPPVMVDKKRCGVCRSESDSSSDRYVPAAGQDFRRAGKSGEKNLYPAAPPATTQRQ